jgi:hypothetical protein
VPQISAVFNTDGKELMLVGDAFLAAHDYGAALNCYKACTPNIIQDQMDLLARTSLLEGWQDKSTLQLAVNADVLLALSAILKRYRYDGVGQVFVGASGIASYGRTAGFLKDARLRELSEKYSHLMPLPGWQWNLETVVWAIRHALQLPGDFAELGVFKGHTSITMADYFDFSVIPKRWYLYDTFDGIPDDQIDSDSWKVANQVYKGTYSFEQVSDTFSSFENISVIKGRVPDILEETCPSQISFLHVDLNNASAEREALEFLYDDHIVPGGVIIFDDYGWTVSEAQYIALNQWADGKGLKILELPTGQGLLMKPA